MTHKCDCNETRCLNGTCESPSPGPSPAPSAAPLPPLPEYVEEAIGALVRAVYACGRGPVCDGVLLAEQVARERALERSIRRHAEEAARGAGACARCGSDGSCDADFHCASCFREMERRARHDPEHAEKERSLTAWRAPASTTRSEP